MRDATAAFAAWKNHLRCYPEAQVPTYGQPGPRGTSSQGPKSPQTEEWNLRAVAPNLLADREVLARSMWCISAGLPGHEAHGRAEGEDQPRRQTPSPHRMRKAGRKMASATPSSPATGTQASPSQSQQGTVRPRSHPEVSSPSLAGASETDPASQSAGPSGLSREEVEARLQLAIDRCDEFSSKFGPHMAPPETHPPSATRISMRSAAVAVGEWLQGGTEGDDRQLSTVEAVEAMRGQMVDLNPGFDLPTASLQRMAAVAPELVPVAARLRKILDELHAVDRGQLTSRQILVAGTKQLRHEFEEAVQDMARRTGQVYPPVFTVPTHPQHAACRC